MKFAIIAVVVLILTISAQASLVPLTLSGPVPLSYTAVHGPALSVAGVPTIAVHAASIPTAVQLHTTPLVVRAPLVVAAEGTYVAQNRGAVHIASLPGHVNSASSVNLEPAPGTY